MYCRNCGNQIDPMAAVCIHCGVAAGNGNRFCPNCGAQTAPGAVYCIGCGAALPVPIPAGMQNQKLPPGCWGFFSALSASIIFILAIQAKRLHS